eukprot:7380174-Prymnesium_polylepis.5
MPGGVVPRARVRGWACCVSLCCVSRAHPQDDGICSREVAFGLPTPDCLTTYANIFPNRYPNTRSSPANMYNQIEFKYWNDAQQQAGVLYHVEFRYTMVAGIVSSKPPGGFDETIL